MFVFEEGADLPTSFSPTLKTKAVLAASLPRKKGTAFTGKENRSSPHSVQQVSLQGSSKQGNVETSLQRQETTEMTTTSFIFIEPIQFSSKAVEPLL